MCLAPQSTPNARCDGSQYLYSLADDRLEGAHGHRLQIDSGGMPQDLWFDGRGRDATNKYLKGQIRFKIPLYLVPHLFKKLLFLQRRKNSLILIHFIS